MSKREAIEENKAELLNSSFYSSSSINTLDHAKNFRNSLILRDLSDQSFTASLESNSLRHEEKLATSTKFPAYLAREDETTTIKMSTSPSLSALASILNEKVRRAQPSVKKSDTTGNSIIEESEDHLPNMQAGIDNVVVSPNLIDVDDTNNVHFPEAATAVDGLISEQPDFLSSPRQAEYGSDSISETSRENDNALQKKNEPEAIVPHKVVENNKNKKDLRVPKQRSVSAEATLEQVSLSANAAATNKKRRNLFSFLRKRSSGENNLKENPNTRDVKNDIPNSTSFSTGSAISSPPPSTKITKKSYSSSNIFNTFKKNKDYKKEHNIGIGSESESTKIPNQEEPNSSATPLHTYEKTRPTKRWSQNVQTGIKGRKPTPLSFEHLAVNEPTDELALPKLTEAADISTKEPVPLPDVRMDTGEALFPKSLSKHEVDSIVSLERSRSTKSNKRSSIASHRRSLTDTLSINAQNEGMFITEAGSVVISTPDLSKSPTSSILRNGRFEPIDFSSNTSAFLSDHAEMPLIENIDVGSGLGISANRNSFSMDSIGEKLDDFTLESEEDIKQNDDTKKHSLSKEVEDDPELMSDIMEFASLINFGEGINLEMDDNITESPYKSVRPVENSVHLSQDIPEEDSMHLSLSQIGSERDVLGISLDDAEGESGIPQNTISNSSPHIYEENYRNSLEENFFNSHEEDDFENENFNEIEKSPESTPKLRQFIPESQIARPISMSFRGLKGPSFNASILGSPNADSVSKEAVLSSWSPENPAAHYVNFSSRIILFDTYGEDEYDRKPDIATCNQLTPQLAQLIKAELNELKCEMDVHEDSRCYTHFY